MTLAMAHAPPRVIRASIEAYERHRPDTALT
jgi:hypothetical protein